MNNSCAHFQIYFSLPDTLCNWGQSPDPKELLCPSEKKIIDEFKKKNPTEKNFDLLKLIGVTTECIKMNAFYIHKIDGFCIHRMDCICISAL